MIRSGSDISDLPCSCSTCTCSMIDEHFSVTEGIDFIRDTSIILFENIQWSLKLFYALFFESFCEIYSYIKYNSKNSDGLPLFKSIGCQTLSSTDKKPIMISRSTDCQDIYSRSLSQKPSRKTTDRRTKVLALKSTLHTSNLSHNNRRFLNDYIDLILKKKCPA